MNVNKKISSGYNKKRDKLPYAVFICPKTNNAKKQDYKQIFTDIISDRIKEKYR